MPDMGNLLEVIEHRAERDADAVIPVLQMLADPDRDVPGAEDLAHDLARRLNDERLAAAERRFRSGAVDTARVRELLGVSRQAVAERVRSGSLLAAKVGSRWAYPGWQVDRTGLAAGLSEVLAALGPITHGDAREADAVMRAPQPDLPDRMSLAELMSLGDTAEVTHRLTIRAGQS